MKKILSGFLIGVVLLIGVTGSARADGANVNLTVKNNGDIVYSDSVALLPAGTVSINDSSGNPHDTNADSVLSVINTADATSDTFNISNLIYYDAFGAFYLKCLNVSGSELCDNWQYKVDGSSPDVGMASKILSGGENVVLYFGNENKAPEPVPEPTPEPAPGPAPTPTHENVSSGSYLVPPQTILPSPVVPSPSPVTPEPILSSPTLAPEVKISPVLPPAHKKLIKKIKKVAKQNTATVINAVPPSTTPVETEIPAPKKNWFVRFWENIFSIF